MAHSHDLPAHARGAGPPATEPSVHVSPRAALADGGETALVTLRVNSPPDANVLEAFIYLTQNGLQTNFVPFSTDGDGHPDRIVVAVPLGDLEGGLAGVSGYFLLDTGQAVNILGEIRLTPFNPAANSAAAEGWVFG